MQVEEPETDELNPEARIARVKDYFKGGKAPPVIKPKPKPRPLKKPPSVSVQESTPSPQLSPTESEVSADKPVM